MSRRFVDMAHRANLGVHVWTVDKENDARRLLDAAGKLMGDVPTAFAKILFARTAPEDLLVYEAAEIAHLARETWAFLGVRKPGQQKARVVSPPASAGCRCAAN